MNKTYNIRKVIVSLIAIITISIVFFVLFFNSIDPIVKVQRDSILADANIGPVKYGIPIGGKRGTYIPIGNDKYKETLPPNLRLGNDIAGGDLTIEVPTQYTYNPTVGCMDTNACNYNHEAKTKGTCSFASYVQIARPVTGTSTPNLSWAILYRIVEANGTVKLSGTFNLAPNAYHSFSGSSACNHPIGLTNFTMFLNAMIGLRR